MPYPPDVNDDYQAASVPSAWIDLQSKSRMADAPEYVVEGTSLCRPDHQIEKIMQAERSRYIDVCKVIESHTHGSGGFRPVSHGIGSGQLRQVRIAFMHTRLILYRPAQRAVPGS